MAKSFKIFDPCQLPDISPSTSDTAEPIDWTKCILCQETNKQVLQSPSDSKRFDVDASVVYQTLADNLLRLNELDCLPCTINLARLDDGTGVASTLKSCKAKWHKICKDKYNSTKVQRAEKRREHEETDDTIDSPRKKLTRYSTGGASRTSQGTCFFCGGTSDDLHKASMDKLDENVRRCAQIVQDHLLIGKLSAGDMMSQDAMYHGKCLKTLYKKAELANHPDSCDQSIKQLHGIALAELLSYIMVSTGFGNIWHNQGI